MLLGTYGFTQVLVSALLSHSWAGLICGDVYTGRPAMRMLMRACHMAVQRWSTMTAQPSIDWLAFA